jgi:hypothetical protein
MRKEKRILSLSLQLVKVGGYDGPRNRHLFFKRPIVDIEFDMPGIHREIHLLICTSSLRST